MALKESYDNAIELAEAIVSLCRASGYIIRAYEGEVCGCIITPVRILESSITF